jgi:hypothetical protein
MRNGILVEILGAAAATLLVSCVLFSPVGDGALRVQGEVLIDGNLANNCTLELCPANSDLCIPRSIISGAFREAFLIGPQASNYFFVVSCPGQAAAFTSPVFEVRNLENFHEPIDLGQIHLLSQ